MEIKEMMIEDIEKRMSEIKELVNAENADIDALTAEVEELRSRKQALKEEAEKRMKLAEDITTGVEATIEVKSFEEEIKMEEKRITVASPEYRDAFYAMIAGNATAEQRAVLATPISVDGNGTNDGQAIAIPKTLDEKIWDNIHTAHPVLADIATVRSGVVMEVTKHTAMTARVSGKKDGATGAGAEENTFVKVTLAGVDYEKYVELTYAEAKMSQGALEDYLAEEIAAELGEALAKDVFAKALSDATASQSVTDTSDMFADIKNALAKVQGRPVIYAPASKYYEIVGAIKSGSPFNIGNVLGCEVKLDEAATKVTLLVPNMFVLNEVQGVMIESEKDIKAHRVIVSGYLRAEGTLRNNKACAYIA